MNRLCYYLLFFVVFGARAIEIDIDKIYNDNYKIYIGNKIFSCTPKTPPLSHGWSYECETNQRNLRASCEKCKKECGGQIPTFFPDDFCEACIPRCY